MRRCTLPLALLSLTLLVACSGGSGTTPATPATPEPAVEPATSGGPSPQFIPTAITDQHVAGFGTFGTLGGTLDLTDLSLTLDPPARNAQLGETFDLDITDFTNENPCVDCMRIDGVQVNGQGQIVLGVSLRHPFKTPSFFFSRPDLNVFDARVILVLGGTDSSNQILTIPDNATAPTTTSGNFGAVANADGFTSHFDSRAEDPRYFDPPKNLAGNINAFKRFFVDPVKTEPFEPTVPSGWNVMPIASPMQVQEFVIDPARLGSGTTVPFVLVAEAAWGVARNKALPDDDPGGRFNPKYWLPEFNQHEPWKVDVEVLNNGLTALQGTSSVQLRVRVADWQAGETVDLNYPDLGNLRGLAVASDVARVRVAIPGVNNVGASQTTPTSGAGSFSDPYIYNFTLQNAEGASTGTYYALVAAEDNLNGSDAGPQRVPELGFPRQGAEIQNYIGYAVAPVTVKDINFPPQVLTSFTPEGGIIDVGQQACFEADVTDLNAEDTHLIEWDFSYDAAVGFTAEGTGASICHTYTAPSINVVAVRVTDNGNPPQSVFINNVATIRVNGIVGPFRLFDAARFDKTPPDGGQSGLGFVSTGPLLLLFSGQDVGEDIFISRTTNGQTWSAPANLSVQAAGDQKRPDMAIAGQAVMIAWEDGAGIRGALSTNGGQNFQAGFQIAANGTLPSVAATQPTIFYVSYSNGGDVFIKANAMGNLGDFTGAATIVNDVTDGLQTRPDMVADPDQDRVYLAWEDSRDPAFGIDIYGATATNRGTTISVNRALSDDRGSADDTEPAMAVAQSGDWVGVVYRSKRYRTTGDILFTKSINQGTTYQPAVVLTAGPVATYSSPTISARNDLTAVMVAYSRLTGTSDYTVRYHISSDGGSFFKAPIDSGAVAFADPSPTVALQPNAGQNISLAWTDQRNAGTQDFGQIFFMLGYEFK